MTIKSYSYRTVPTVKAFNSDRSFIKAIMGPFRSGKSSGCVMNLVELAMAQTPMEDGVRRSRWAVVRNCFDDQTEILTEKRGWQLFKDLNYEDKIGSYDGGELKFVIPINYYKYSYDGEMIGCKSEVIDFLVTPEHKLYVSRINGRTKERAPYEFREASEVYGKTNIEFQTTTEWKGGKAEYSELFFEFLGFWFAEGSAGKYQYGNKTPLQNWTITQKGNEKYVESLLSANGISYIVCKRPSGDIYRLNINGHVSLFSDLCKCGKSIERRIPLWIKSAPASHLRAFIHGYINGDGHLRSEPHDVTRAWTSSRWLASDIQEISIRAGYFVATSCRDKIRKGKKSTEWVITFFSDRKLHPQPRNTKGKSWWYKKQYSGMVYCVEVPSHLVVTRRNGKNVIISQSYPQLRDTTIPTVFDWLYEFGDYNKSDYDFVLNKLKAPDGSPVEAWFHFRALDKPRDIRNLLSLEVTGAWFNEAKEIPKRIIDTMRGRVGQYPAKRHGGATWGGILMDTNPPDTDHWFYRLFEVDRPQYCPTCRDSQGGIILFIDGHCPKCNVSNGVPFVKLFKQPSGRGPSAENLSNLPIGYYATITAGMDKDFIRVFADGEYGYVSDGKPVYLVFDDEKHISKEKLKADPSYPIIIGFDNTGRDQAAVICQYLPIGQFRVLHEFIMTDTGTRTLVREIVKPFILTHYPGCQLILTGDPAGVKASDTDDRNTFQEISEAFNIQATPARSNALSPRLNAVESFLKKYIGGNKFGMLISPDCPLIIKGFRGEYRMRRLQLVGQERYTDKPEKNLVSHGHDALQYACMSVEDAITLSQGYITLSGNLGPIIVQANPWAAFT